ncbi:MAG: c-type cytochrome [Acidimicrobiales bacterium]|nr:c-type cytochrome [Acidimicrobiales bacterium]
MAALIVIGCGASQSAPLSESAAYGKDLFDETSLAGNAGCITCHSLTPEKDLVGPSMAGIGSRAGQRQPGVAAGEYIRTSIVAPDTFVVPGFDDNKMPKNWGEVLSEAEIQALVDYLLTVIE